jgi:tartrate/fumarate subfamily iron-sulfur-dependent hydro-lyase alpha chain
VSRRSARLIEGVGCIACRVEGTFRPPLATMLTGAKLEDTIVDLWRSNQFDLPRDFKSFLQEQYDSETNAFGKAHLKANLDAVAFASSRGTPFCADTGLLSYYVIIGTAILPEIEGGYGTLEKVLENVTSRVTAEIPLRPNAVHPLTRHNPNTNRGPGCPDIKIRLVPEADFLEITNVAIGGGPELVGSKFTVLSPTAGEKGVRKFVVESAIHLVRLGATCSPNVIGVGLGGTFEKCAQMAKEAAILRPMRSRHSDPEIARLEDQLMEDIRRLKLGPMGMGGSTSAFDVRIELAYCHMATLPVAVYLQCAAMRRTTVRLYADGRVEKRRFSSWLDPDARQSGTDK